MLFLVITLKVHFHYSGTGQRQGRVGLKSDLVQKNNYFLSFKYDRSHLSKTRPWPKKYYLRQFSLPDVFRLNRTSPDKWEWQTGMNQSMTLICAFKFYFDLIIIPLFSVFFNSVNFLPSYCFIFKYYGSRKPDRKSPNSFKFIE